MIFITDLDHTILYSKRELNVDAIPVEYIDKKPITYMTEKALTILNELRTTKDFVFIPCTLRDFSQTMRLSFIQSSIPKFMICENGGRIYINGQEDLHYREFVEHSFNLNLEKARKIVNTIPCKIKENKTFITCIFNTDEKAMEWSNYIKLLLPCFDFDLQHRKFYIIPHGLDKSIAVKYLIQKYDLENIITSGDGLVDEKFVNIGDLIILPQNVKFLNKKAYVTKNIGVKAGEEILEKIREQVFVKGK